MGRKKKPENIKLEQYRGVRFAKEENDFVLRLVDARGCTMSEAIRYCVKLAAATAVLMKRDETFRRYITETAKGVA